MEHGAPLIYQAALTAGSWLGYATIREIANAEKINETYVGRVLRLTLLAPDILQAILDGRQPGLQLDHLMKRFPVVWEAQLNALTVIRAAGTETELAAPPPVGCFRSK